MAKYIAFHGYDVSIFAFAYGAKIFVNAHRYRWPISRCANGVHRIENKLVHPHMFGVLNVLV